MPLLARPAGMVIPAAAPAREQAMKPRLGLPIAVIIVMLGAFALAMALG
ncbi:hypothetical protein [Roseococcus sp. SYP-B2431]|nr:hypothetical protein [Roseococcus sp. SYP-B2431]